MDLRLYGMKRSKCAEESRRAEIEEELAMTPGERVLLALSLGIELELMLNPDPFADEEGDAPASSIPSSGSGRRWPSPNR